jgi:DNA-binding transcriptional LysR family regulator
MAHDHPLAGQAAVTPADLHGFEIVALTHRHARRGQLERLLHQAKARVRVVAEVSTSFAAADLAKEGMGVAIINPFPLYHYRSGDLRFVPFTSSIRYQSHLVVSEQRPVPRIARAFMRHLRLNTPQDPFSRKG